MDLTPLQLLWLRTRGDRTKEDVIEIDNVLYYEAYWPKNDVQYVRIPSDESINKDYFIERFDIHHCSLKARKQEKL